MFVWFVDLGHGLRPWVGSSPLSASCSSKALLIGQEAEPSLLSSISKVRRRQTHLEVRGEEHSSMDMSKKGRASNPDVIPGNVPWSSSGFVIGERQDNFQSTHIKARAYASS